VNAKKTTSPMWGYEMHLVRLLKSNPCTTLLILMV
jgi:hypothetical protein